MVDRLLQLCPTHFPPRRTKQLDWCLKTLGIGEKVRTPDHRGPDRSHLGGAGRPDVVHRRSWACLVAIPWTNETETFFLTYQALGGVKGSHALKSVSCIHLFNMISSATRYSVFHESPMSPIHCESSKWQKTCDAFIPTGDEIGAQDLLPHPGLRQQRQPG